MNPNIFNKDEKRNLLGINKEETPQLRKLKKEENTDSFNTWSSFDTKMRIKQYLISENIEGSLI